MNSLYIAQLLVRRVLGKRRRLLVLMLIPAVVVAVILSLFREYRADGILVQAVNADSGELGAILLEEWSGRPELVVRLASSREKAEAQVMRQLAEAAILIPANFTEELLAGRQPQVELNQMRYDATTDLLEEAIRSETQQLAMAVTLAQVEGGGDAVQRVKSIYGMKRDKGAVSAMKSRDYTAVERTATFTGIYLIFLMGSAASTLSVIREDRRSALMARLHAMPVGQGELMLGHFLGCLTIGTLQIVFVLALSRLLPGGEVEIGFWSQWLVLECFLLATIGLFAAVAALFQDSDSLTTVHSLIMTPTCMLGGCFWPVELMPEAMQKLSHFMPQRWVIDAVAKLAAGGSLRDIPYHIGILLLMAVLLLSFGTALVAPGGRSRM